VPIVSREFPETSVSLRDRSLKNEMLEAYWSYSQAHQWWKNS